MNDTKVGEVFGSLSTAFSQMQDARKALLRLLDDGRRRLTVNEIRRIHTGLRSMAEESFDIAVATQEFVRIAKDKEALEALPVASE